MNKVCLTLAIIFCGWCSLQSQEPYFIQHEISEVHVNAQINMVYQDRNCLMWLGTSEGMISFNGFEMRRPEAYDTLVDHSITAIFEDSKENMWVGFENGNVYQHHQDDKLEPVVFEEGWPNVRITGFAEDLDGNLWFSTYGEGVYCYNGQYLYNYNMDDGMLGDDIYCIVSDQQGRIWCGTDGGVNICTFSAGQKAIESITSSRGLPDQIIKIIQPDAHGNMWIGTYDGGVCYFDIAHDSIYNHLSDPTMGAINALEVFDNLDVWIGTSTGLWRYDLRNQQYSRIGSQSELASSRINDLFKDIEGNLWVISNLNDIHTAFRQFESMDVSCGDIQALYMCSTDQLWIGTNQGLFTLPESGKGVGLVQHLPLLDLNVTAIIQDSFQNIWVGTLDQGIFIYNSQNGSHIRLHRANGLINNSIMSFDQSGQTLWIATLGGVAAYNLQRDILTRAEKGRAITMMPDLSSRFIYQVYVDRDGNPWFASDGDGVFVIRDGNTTQYTGNDSIQLKTVYSITQDQHGHMWMTTPKEGLVEFDGSDFSRLGLQDGLSNLSISSLVTDHRGDILIIHTDGIDVLKPAERHFMYFDDEIGIEKLDPGLNAHCVDMFDAIWIGSNNKLIRYPALEEELSIHPRTQLKNVSVFLEPVDYFSKSEFKHHENYISFDYVGLWYTSPTSVKYLYKLDGYDLEWKESKDHLASYSNIPPGEYNFMVKASENKFFHDEPIAEYAFTVDKPFYAKVWFLVLAAAFFSGLIFLFTRFRERRSERQALLKKEKIESQFMALKAQINPHFLFNSFNTLITIIEESPEIAVEYVEKLSDFYRSILQFREKETISLQEELDVVHSYWFLLQKRFGNNLRIDVHVNGLKSSIPPLTIQMLVENAVKHNIISKSRPLSIEIHNDNDRYISVKNNKQLKISPVRSTKFGLQSIVKRYQLLSDRKVLIAETDTHFQVSVPVLTKEQ